MLKRTFILSLLFCCCISLSAATESVSAKLCAMFEQLIVATDTAEMRTINDSIRNVLTEKLKSEDSFATPFDSVRFLGRVVSDDGKISIYSWNYVYNRFRFAYNCIIQTVDGEMFYFSQKEPFKPDEYEPSDTAAPWYGALYYDLVPFERDGEVSYLCFGWSRHRRTTQLKMVDVLSFVNGKPRFGMPIFKDNSGMVKCRLIYEYDGQVQMSLEYDKRKKRILVDHLSPMRQNMFGDKVYAPDMSVDAYYRKGNYWIIKEDVKVNNIKDYGNSGKYRAPAKRVWFKPE